jgi:hypothetical protein
MTRKDFSNTIADVKAELDFIATLLYGAGADINHGAIPQALKNARLLIDTLIENPDGENGRQSCC